MENCMQAVEALEFISQQFVQRRGVVLSEGARDELLNLLDNGRKRAVAEVDESAFDSAVRDLTGQLLQSVLLEAAVGTEEEEEGEYATAGAEGVQIALAGICPLWPFCK